jgi:hypothetical protein
MPKVYVIQNHASYDKSTGLMVPRYDLSPAEEFGELEFLLSPVTVPNKPERAIAELRKKLCNFSDDDYLLLIGNPCFIGWSCTIAADINDGKVAMLQYNGSRKQYYVVKAEGLIDLE